MHRRTASRKCQHAANGQGLDEEASEKFMNACHFGSRQDDARGGWNLRFGRVADKRLA
jgi:hypothetical protein